MIRVGSALILILLVQTAFSQAKPIKRKYRGIYVGEIQSYEVQMGAQKMKVSPVTCKLYLERDSLFIEIGNKKYAAAYSIEKLDQTYKLTAERTNSGIAEVFYLDPRTKSMVRKGLYPQPDAELQRSGRLPRR